MSKNKIIWELINVYCFNYRKNGTIKNRHVAIGTDRFCHSDCECTDCPVHKENKQ